MVLFRKMNEENSSVWQRNDNHVSSIACVCVCVHLKCQDKTQTTTRTRKMGKTARACIFHLLFG